MRAKLYSIDDLQNIYFSQEHDNVLYIFGCYFRAE
jgi:hypothetical protein